MNLTFTMQLYILCVRKKTRSRVFLFLQAIMDYVQIISVYWLSTIRQISSQEF